MHTRRRRQEKNGKILHFHSFSLFPAAVVFWADPKVPCLGGTFCWPRLIFKLRPDQTIVLWEETIIDSCGHFLDWRFLEEEVGVGKRDEFFLIEFYIQVFSVELSAESSL